MISGGSERLRLRKLAPPISRPGSRAANVYICVRGTRGNPFLREPERARDRSISEGGSFARPITRLDEKKKEGAREGVAGKTEGIVKYLHRYALSIERGGQKNCTGMRVSCARQSAIWSLRGIAGERVFSDVGSFR